MKAVVRSLFLALTLSPLTVMAAPEMPTMPAAPSVPAVPAKPSVPAAMPAMPAAPAATIDINSATATQLESLPGIGPAKAKAIVDYRTQNGPFQSAADLEKVPGIGPKNMQQLTPLISANPISVPAVPGVKK
ncbi:MAG: helix-hairpin-helix domain-containing protein [Pseudomonadota bacterium]